MGIFDSFKNKAGDLIDKAEGLADKAKEHQGDGIEDQAPPQQQAGGFPDDAQGQMGGIVNGARNQMDRDIDIARQRITHDDPTRTDA